MEIADAEAAAHILVAALRSLEYPWVMGEKALTTADQTDAMLNILLNRLRKRN